MTTAQQWKMRGEYIENCNCDVLCPCTTSLMKAAPDNGHCNAVLGFHIQEGSHGAVPLNGLSFVMALHTPGPMGEGNGRLAVYVDEKADDRQRESMGTILGGQAGGMPAMIPDLIPISEMLGMKFVPITFSVDGKKRHLDIPGIMELNVEGIEGVPGQVMQLTNAFHPANPTISLAKGTKSTYKDYDFDWDITGGNGNYSPFEWGGP
ncbi:MAG: DUF1326 domain-containing protein [Dehalococcoidia bacterium]